MEDCPQFPFFLGNFPDRSSVILEKLAIFDAEMQENKSLHNALRQVRLHVGKVRLCGFSVSGLATYLQLPEHNFCVDMGECPISAIGIDHVFLTHAHGDHSRCLMRHHSLRRMMGVEKPSVYYISEELVPGAEEWIHAEASFEGVPESRFKLPKIIPVKAGEKQALAYRKDLYIEAFNVRHASLGKHFLPAMGITLYNHKNKLKDEFLGLDSSKLIELRQKGTCITREVFDPLITFMGDSLGENLLDPNLQSVWDSEILVTECTFLDDEEEEMAQKKGHTHISAIAEALQKYGDTMKCKHVVLNHFSMKYSAEHILETLQKKIPEEFQEKIIAFI